MDDLTNGTKAPCLKHAVSNLAEKSNGISSDVSLCSHCSKTMLSYIFLIQDVLDNLAKSIYGKRDSECCVQCLRQAAQAEPLQLEQSLVDESKKMFNDVSKDEAVNNVVNREVSNQEDTIVSTIANKPKKPSSRRNSRRLSREIKNLDKTPMILPDINHGNQDWKINFLYDVSPYSDPFLSTVNSDSFKKITIQNKHNEFEDESRREQSDDVKTLRNEISPNSNSIQQPLNGAVVFIENEVASSLVSADTSSSLSEVSWEDNIMQQQHICVNDVVVKENGTEPFQNMWNSDGGESPLLSTEDSCRYDILQDPETFPVYLSIASNRTPKLPEAFVTMCKNDFEAIGCLVLGSSLLLCRSSKILCVLVSEGVHEKLCELLASIFHVVQNVSLLEPIRKESKSRNSRKPFEVLNVWRLKQFSKCVFLKYDTLVLRNCDELFDFSELSAAPDNGWPDCFNCGVFVYVPSLTTFKKMNDMHETQGYSEGGEQIFLNMYFSTWAEDLSKQLPFIYNLNLIGASNYTYAAAFQRFGQNVKIVQFSGSLKPWHIEFCSESNQIMDSSGIPQTSLRFINEWMNIFRVSVTRLLPMDVYSLTFTQKSISAQDIISFLCVPAERHCRAGFGTYKQANPPPVNNFTENNNQRTKYFSVFQHDIKPAEKHIHNKLTKLQCLEESSEDENLAEISISPEELSDFPLGKVIPISSVITSLPVTCDNYDGMRLWEQGKMDYEGIDNSESIIKRLQLLIQ